ncbi:MAG: GDSL-type esterase/lipase family protein [Limisphaerales bacterium]
MPESTDLFLGKGPMQPGAWFKGLWAKRRTEWWNSREQDKGAVVFLGDSITHGWGGVHTNFPGVKIANRGISGDTTRGVLFRLREDVLDLDPEAIVLLIGTNDIGLNGSPEDAAYNIRLILSSIRAYAKTPVVLCKIMPASEKVSRPADKIQQLNAMVDGMIKDDPQFIRVDTWSIFADDSGSARKEEFPDLLHPNDAGYAKWAEALRPVFAQLGLGKQE